MNQPNAQPSPRIDQSQQSGGVSLGAYNQITHLELGDVVAGDKTVIQKIELIRYIGNTRPHNQQMRADLLRAYCSEVAARYAIWRQRYATIPMMTHTLMVSHPTSAFHEREDLTFIALRQAYTVYNRPEKESPLEKYVFTDLRDGLARFDHLLLLGPPGGGKTTALWRLALDLAEVGMAGDCATSLPIFVRLGGLQPNQSLRELIEKDLTSASLENAQGLRFPLTAHRALVSILDELLDEGHLVLLWDGLNEVPRSCFASSASELEVFRHEHPGSLKGARTQSVVTCRADDHILLLEECKKDPYPVQSVTIQGLDKETIHQMVIGRLGTSKGSALLEALSLPEHVALAGLARTPLLLTMLCEVYDAAGILPYNRGQLLQQFVVQRWAWERQRRQEGWITAEVQKRAFSQLAYSITEGSGRGTSVSTDWAKAQIRKTVLRTNIIELLRLGRAADLIEFVADGLQMRFTHQLVQEYFTAVELQKKLRQAKNWQILPFWGGDIAQSILRKFSRQGERTGWEETLLLLAGIEGNTGMGRALIRNFVSQPLQAARLLEAESVNGDPALQDEVRTAALQDIIGKPFDIRRRLDAGRALGLIGDLRFPVHETEWPKSLVSLSNTLISTGDHYWRYVPAGSYRVGVTEKDFSSALHDISHFWIARFPVTVSQFARFWD